LIEEACVKRLGGVPYTVCFDLGNTLSFTAGVEGAGGEIALRHLIRTQDPTIWWRFSHRITSVVVSWDEELRGTLYEGRYLRHSRDGRLTIPTSPPKSIYLPFDVGAEATVLRVSGHIDDDTVSIRAVRAGILFDLARAADFRRRLTIGSAVIWDLEARRSELEVLEHRVVPFSAGQLEGYLESRDGLTRASARVEGGMLWSTVDDWKPFITAGASLERVIFAVNDRPFALYAAAAYEDPGRGFTVSAGVRFVVAGGRPWSQSFKIPDRHSTTH
jgi:hypothetical protein